MNLLSIHQPEFLPWLGYFHKILVSGEFVFLDHVQFKKKNFQNRNQILQNKKNRQWLTVPVTIKRRNTAISDVLILKNNLYKKILRKIEYNYRGHDYFNDIYPLIYSCFQEKPRFLSDLNISLIRLLSYRLGIQRSFKRTSEIPLQELPSGGKTELIHSLCKYYGADAFLCGAGARETFFDETIFTDIIVIYHQFTNPTYTQHGNESSFLSHLSILDALFNLGFIGVRRLLEKQILTTQ